MRWIRDSMFLRASTGAYVVVGCEYAISSSRPTTGTSTSLVGTSTSTTVVRSSI